MSSLVFIRAENEDTRTEKEGTGMQESLLAVTGNCRKPLARKKKEVEDLMLRPKDPEKSYKLWEKLKMY